MPARPLLMSEPQAGHLTGDDRLHDLGRAARCAAILDERDTSLADALDEIFDGSRPKITSGRY
jgi:hypothetical protein